MDSFDVEGFDTTLKPHVQMLVLYDRRHARQRAFELYERIAQQLGPDYVMHAQGLSFELLGDSKTRKTAADYASDAELVVIAACSDRELPREVRSCLELWFDERRGGKQALIALLCTPVLAEAVNSPLYTCLHEAARDAQVDFFHQAFPPGDITDDLDSEFLRSVEQPVHTSMVVEDALRRSYPVRRWGLNE